MKHLTRLVLLAALSPAAYSQTALHTFDGDSEGDGFGVSVSGAGDVNGDGHADLIVGAWGDDNNGTSSGSARVFSGRDGSILHTFNGDSPFDFFGFSVSGAGDVNGDGYADLIVGARNDDNNGTDSGSARVFSGRDGSVIYSFDGDSALDYFGFSVSGAGDVNADGFDDLIVGAWGDDNKGYNSGSARVFSGVDGKVLYTRYGDDRDDEFGYTVSGAGDVNGDGFADLIVGAPRAGLFEGGMARVFSGKNGKVRYTFDGEGGHDFGTSVSGAGDVNGDGYDDLIVGAPGGYYGWWPGFAQVLSGVDGSILYTFDGESANDGFGNLVSGAGDVNGDGYDDLIVVAPGDDNNGKNFGRILVFSGRDGGVLYTFDGDSTLDYFGFSVSGAGDVNADGFDDLIIGAHQDDNNGKNSGSARAHSGWSSIGTNYCGPAVPNSTLVAASILALGSDTAVNDELWLRAINLPAGKNGYFLTSATQGFVPMPGNSQGNLCLSGQVGRFRKQMQKSSSGGVLSIRVDLTRIPTTPPHTVMAGETWNFQAWFRDKNPGPTSNFTDAVSVTFK